MIRYEDSKFVLGGDFVVVDLIFYVPPIVCGGSVMVFELKHILLPNFIQQWGWVTSSHNLSYDPSPFGMHYFMSFLVLQSS